jgi:hypothetical protein
VFGSLFCGEMRVSPVASAENGRETGFEAGKFFYACRPCGFDEKDDSQDVVVGRSSVTLLAARW